MHFSPAILAYLIFSQQPLCSDCPPSDSNSTEDFILASCEALCILLLYTYTHLYNCTLVYNTNYVCNPVCHMTYKWLSLRIMQH